MSTPKAEPLVVIPKAWIDATRDDLDAIAAEMAPPGVDRRRAAHLPHLRKPSVTGLTLVGVLLALIGSAFAAGFLVGLGARLADWLALPRGP